VYSHNDYLFNPNGDPTQAQPFWSTAPFDYVVGPPAVPFFGNGKYPSGFAGYSPGFMTFELAPVAGSYALKVLVPATNTTPVTYTASAALASTAALGTITATFASDGSGGATGTVTTPAGVTEAEVFIYDATTNQYFTASITGIAGAGTQSYTVANNLGSCTTSCPNPKQTFNSGDTIVYTAVGYDYPAIEASSPTSTTAKPAIAGANGQADLTMSTINQATY
ncbi:MAG TPA: hypothetical protein VFN37_03115, partial [Candidatus Baltobacteraceae bacterium]|nr:hypothetical protein [Candidatus Baltobacteraceae bacterium]